MSDTVESLSQQIGPLLGFRIFPFPRLGQGLAPPVLLNSTAAAAPEAYHLSNQPNSKGLKAFPIPTLQLGTNPSEAPPSVASLLGRYWEAQTLNNPLATRGAQFRNAATLVSQPAAGWSSAYGQAQLTLNSANLFNPYSHSTLVLVSASTEPLTQAQWRSAFVFDRSGVLTPFQATTPYFLNSVATLAAYFAEHPTFTLPSSGFQYTQWGTGLKVRVDANGELEVYGDADGGATLVGLGNSAQSVYGQGFAATALSQIDIAALLAAIATVPTGLGALQLLSAPPNSPAASAPLALTPPPQVAGVAGASLSSVAAALPPLRIAPPSAAAPPALPNVTAPATGQQAGREAPLPISTGAAPASVGLSGALPLQPTFQPTLQPALQTTPQTPSRPSVVQRRVSTWSDLGLNTPVLTSPEGSASEASEALTPLHSRGASLGFLNSAPNGDGASLSQSPQQGWQQNATAATQAAQQGPPTPQQAQAAKARARRLFNWLEAVEEG